MRVPNVLTAHILFIYFNLTKCAENRTQPAVDSLQHLAQDTKYVFSSYVEKPLVVSMEHSWSSNAVIHEYIEEALCKTVPLELSLIICVFFSMYS